MDQADHSGNTFRINEVAQKVGLSQKRIREYEKAGFIRPIRQPRTNNRLFTESDINRIERIKQLLHEYGFTLTCLRYFMASAPCWTIFNCSKKKSCSAYRYPHNRCYETVKSDNGTTDKICKNCPVYLNRDVQGVALLEKS